MADHYILMKDTPGEKPVSSSIVSVIKNQFMGGNSSHQMMILRGELLGQIPPIQQQPRSGGLAHNYYVDKDPCTTLFVVDEQGVSPLSLEEYRLLRAIDSTFDRFNVFVNGDWLERGVKLKAGNQVFVRLPGLPGPTVDWSVAIIRYKGDVRSLPGTNFGVEIYDPQHHGKGSSDGYFQGYQYFKCENNCGMFVSLAKISFGQHLGGIQSESQSQTQYVPAITGDAKESYAAKVLSKPHSSNGGHDASKIPPQGTGVDPASISSKAKPRYKTNDRVVIFDKDGIALYGTVKWTGKKIRFSSGGIHVGIEMDVRVNTTEVPGSTTGIIDWFTVKKHHTVVIPESLVIPEAAYVAGGKKKPQRLAAQQDRPLNMIDPLAMARDYGMTERQFVAEQHKMLKEAEKQKKKQGKEIASQNRQVEEIKLALGESINVATQKQLFADFRKKGKEEGNGQQPYLHPTDQSSLGIKRQHSWQPGADRVYEVMPGDADIHRRLGLQGKSSSIVDGDRTGQFYQDNQQHHRARGGNRYLARIPGPPGSSSPQQQQQQHYSGEQIQEEHEHVHNQMSRQQYGQGGGYDEGDQQQGIALHQQQGIQGVGGVSPYQQHKVDKFAHHNYINLEDHPEEPHSHSQPDRVAVESPPNIQQRSFTEHTELSRERMQQIEKLSQQIKELEDNYNALQQKQKKSESQVVQLQKDLEREQHQRKGSEDQRVQLQQDLQKEKESSAKLQQQLSEIKAENRSLQNSQLESVAFGIEPWKVSRKKVELGNVLGGGGWGVVYEGKLQVAVKHFYPNIMSKQNVSRLKREMRMLALIRHPNLLQFIAAVFDENEDHVQRPPYIITELLDTSLRSAYENALVPSHSLLSIFIDTARALDYLHRRHEPIIHRDVSSANVLLKRKENGKWIAKLSDLGSANLAKEAYTRNEGAPVYCAPEAFTSGTIARLAGTLTPKVDVYSYGIMLCEVATSTFPDGEKFPSMLSRVQHEWLQLYQLIVACTNQSPEQRPTMANMLASLEAFPPRV